MIFLISDLKGAEIVHIFIQFTAVYRALLLIGRKKSCIITLKNC